MALRGKLTVFDANSATTLLSLTGKGILKLIAVEYDEAGSLQVNIDGQGTVYALDNYLAAYQDAARDNKSYKIAMASGANQDWDSSDTGGYASGSSGAYWYPDSNDEPSYVAVFNIPFATSLVITAVGSTVNFNGCISTVLEV